MVIFSGLDKNPSIFCGAPLKKFFTKILAEMNPVLSTSAITLDYYDRIFNSCIMSRVCYTFWDIKNDQENYQYWPEALKSEAFVEKAWKENYDDLAVSKWIYDW